MSKPGEYAERVWSDPLQVTAILNWSHIFLLISFPRTIWLQKNDVHKFIWQVIATKQHYFDRESVTDRTIGPGATSATWNNSGSFFTSKYLTIFGEFRWIQVRNRHKFTWIDVAPKRSIDFNWEYEFNWDRYRSYHTTHSRLQNTDQLQSLSNSNGRRYKHGCPAHCAFRWRRNWVALQSSCRGFGNCEREFKAFQNLVGSSQTTFRPHVAQSVF